MAESYVVELFTLVNDSQINNFRGCSLRCTVFWKRSTSRFIYRFWI